MIPRRLNSLFHPACRHCGARCRTDLCPTCVERLPLERRWEFRDAYDSRRHDRTGYRVALTRAVAWLAANPKRNAETATTAKEKP